MINLIDLAERAVLPDWLIRLGMRRLMAGRVEEERQRADAQSGESLRHLFANTRSGTTAARGRGGG